MTAEDLNQLTNQTFQSYGVKKAALFGSRARGNAAQNSDYDILVELGKKMSLLDFVGLKQDLEEILGRKVDLVQYKTIKPALRDFILHDEKVIYQL
jgi:hypothetical protein